MARRKEEVQQIVQHREGCQFAQYSPHSRTKMSTVEQNTTNQASATFFFDNQENHETLVQQFGDHVNYNGGVLKENIIMKLNELRSDDKQIRDNFVSLLNCF